MIPAEFFTRVSTALAADYEIVRPLGQGGMATVFLAREKSLKREVAIKVLTPDLASPAFLTRFAREAETAAQLQHPHIVPIYRVGEAGGLAYYAMGYVEGETLADRMAKLGALPLDDAVRVATEVAAALGAAHRRGIVHRDVKPQNIMLEHETGRALVTDFGIARVLPTLPADAGDSDIDRLTGMGMVLGTPRYMSPEQATGERDLTPASDMYSLGIIFYEMLTGAYPYKPARGSTAMVAHLTQSPIRIDEVNPSLPEHVVSAVGSLLDKNPENRPGPAALRAALGDQFAQPTERIPVPRRRTRWTAARLGLMAVIGILVLGGVATVIRDNGGPPRGVDPRKSLLIGFFDNTSNDPALQWLRMGGVDLLAQSLRRWQDLQVVEVDRLLDLAREAGVDDQTRLSRDRALGLARAAGVWTAAIGSIFPAGDSIRVSLNVYDVASGKQLRTATASAPVQDPGLAFNALANEVLDLAHVPQSSLIDVEPPTRSLDAYRAYLDGITARNRWDLDSATTAFRRAISLDSVFALAYYELSLSMYVSELLTPDPSFIGLSDSALLYSRHRPPKERQLIEAYNFLVHSDFEKAKQLYLVLLSRDSTLAEAWHGLGAASMLDFTLRKDSRGREYLPIDVNLARRSFERSIQLDPSDHRFYGNLANVFALAALDQDAQIPSFRQPPSGDINTLGDRFPVRFYTAVLVRDSFVLVPTESLHVRYPRPLVDSLRKVARVALNDLLDRWMRIAPDEGQAWMLKAGVNKLDKNYDEALVALKEAERLGGVSIVPFPYQRLALLLMARRLEEAAALGDSLNRAPPQSGSAFLRAGSVNAWFLRGQLQAGSRGTGGFFHAARAITQDSEVTRFLDISESAAPVRIRASAGVATREEVQRMEAGVQNLGTAHHGESRSAWASLVRNLSFAAATVGDTAMVNRWTSEARRPAFQALAYARAGDRTAAERYFVAASRDTLIVAMHRFALGQVAEMLNRPQDALRFYTALDSSNFDTGSPDADWILLVRSLAARGALYEAQGDLARAREFYQRFLALWQSADSNLKPQVDRVRQALGELDRQDRTDN